MGRGSRSTRLPAQLRLCAGIAGAIAALPARSQLRHRPAGLCQLVDRSRHQDGRRQRRHARGQGRLPGSGLLRSHRRGRDRPAVAVDADMRSPRWARAPARLPRARRLERPDPDAVAHRSRCREARTPAAVPRAHTPGWPPSSPTCGSSCRCGPARCGDHDAVDLRAGATPTRSAVCLAVPDGSFIVVTPTARHLAEIVDRLGMVSVDPRGQAPQAEAESLSGRLHPDRSRPRRILDGADASRRRSTGSHGPVRPPPDRRPAGRPHRRPPRRVRRDRLRHDLRLHPSR